MKDVGYLVKHRDGIRGERGFYYNYILASNGLFVEAENPLIAAKMLVAECEIRGLAPLLEDLVLTYGSIPQRFFDLALSTFLAYPEHEYYAAVIGDKGYHFHVPVQNREEGSVVYEVGDSVVLDIHSHGSMPAGFSTQDNLDEQGMKIFAVVGNLNATPVVKLRLGVYGYFRTLCWKDVFDGTLTGATEDDREEVIPIDGLRCITQKHTPEV
jgi:PRTRC genetic system protein A